MAAVEEPLTAGDLDRWTSGLPSADAGAALLMLGLDAGRLDAWVRASGSAAPGEGVFLDWGARQADRDAQGLADLAGQVRLPQTFDAEQPASTAPPLRVAVQDGGVRWSSARGCWRSPGSRRWWCRSSGRRGRCAAGRGGGR